MRASLLQLFPMESAEKHVAPKEFLRSRPPVSPLRKALLEEISDSWTMRPCRFDSMDHESMWITQSCARMVTPGNLCGPGGGSLTFARKGPGRTPGSKPSAVTKNRPGLKLSERVTLRRLRRPSAWRLVSAKEFCLLRRVQSTIIPTISAITTISVGILRAPLLPISSSLRSFRCMRLTSKASLSPCLPNEA